MAELLFSRRWSEGGSDIFLTGSKTVPVGGEVTCKRHRMSKVTPAKETFMFLHWHCYPVPIPNYRPRGLRDRILLYICMVELGRVQYYHILDLFPIVPNTVTYLHVLGSKRITS